MSHNIVNSSHIAGEDDQAICCNLLLDSGADYKVENKAKLTVFDLCKLPLRKRLIEKLKLGE